MRIAETIRRKGEDGSERERTIREENTGRGGRESDVKEEGEKREGGGKREEGGKLDLELCCRVGGEEGEGGFRHRLSYRPMIS